MTGYVLFDRDRPELLLEFPEVREGLTKTLSAAKQQAEGTAGVVGWFKPATFGDMFPKSGQYGITSIIPSQFQGTNTFSKTFAGAPAFVDIINNTTPEDQIYGIQGYAFDSPLRFSTLRTKIADTDFPMINIEEAQTMARPALIFKQGNVILPKKHITTRGFLETNGTQRVVPIGFMLFNRIDDVTTEF